MATQAADLHRSLLRPMIIHTLRGVGFHSTKPSVLDALVDIAERHLLLLASSTAQHAQSMHNDPVPTIADVRNALTECGMLVPYTDATEEQFREKMRRPLTEYLTMKGGHVRLAAERRRRDEEDTRDVKEFTSWFEGPHYTEIRRVAGLSEASTTGPGNIGVGGGLMHTDDLLVSLKKKYGKNGQESEARFADTVLGKGAELSEYTIEGSNIKKIREWTPNTSKQDQEYASTAMEVS